MLIWGIRTVPVLALAPRDYVLISDFENKTGDPVFDRSLGTALATSLDQSARINVYSRARIKETLKRFVEGKGINHLSRDPLGGRIVPHTDAHYSPAGVAKNYKAVEQLEGNGANHKQIDGGDPGGVIVQESLPALRGWSLPLRHVPRHG